MFNILLGIVDKCLIWFLFYDITESLLNNTINCYISVCMKHLTLYVDVDIVNDVNIFKRIMYFTICIILCYVPFFVCELTHKRNLNTLQNKIWDHKWIIQKEKKNLRKSKNCVQDNNQWPNVVTCFGMVKCIADFLKSRLCL